MRFPKFNGPKIRFNGEVVGMAATFWVNEANRWIVVSSHTEGEQVPMLRWPANLYDCLGPAEVLH